MHVSQVYLFAKSLYTTICTLNIPANTLNSPNTFLFGFSDDPGALRWCCDQLWQNPDITPKVEPSPKLKENMIKWKDKQCYVAVGKEAKPRCDGKMA